jgi:nucleotide-binding universal stress UspA family protein
MKRQTQKKILVPVDGSGRSLNTVRYISRMDSFLNKQIVLFHVFNSVPEAYWDLEKDPRSSSTVKQVKAWEVEQRKNVDVFMQRAQQLFWKAGFHDKSIKIKIQNRKKGIARDIIREAQNGYEAVVTRRRGATGLRGIVLGSVATKLVEKLSFLPLILAGKSPAGNKILLAFDDSEDAMRAVEFIGSFMGGLDYEVGLLHVIRGNGQDLPEYQHIFSSKKYTEFSSQLMASSLDKARIKLIDSGFKPNKVSIKLIKGVHSRAKAIADEAKKEGYGTIVMGRRGHSRVRNFFIGRVTNKAIHMARDRTIWIVR